MRNAVSSQRRNGKTKLLNTYILCRLTVTSRVTDLALSVSMNRKRALQRTIDSNASSSTNTNPSRFSTSTPARAKGPAPRPSFGDLQSPVATQPLTQPIEHEMGMPPGAPRTSQPLGMTQHPQAPKPYIFSEEEKTLESKRLHSEIDLLLTAKAYFDAREFKRVCYMLQACQSDKAKFLMSFSFYLVSSSLPGCEI